MLHRNHTILDLFRLHRSLLTNIVCLVLMLNLSAPALATSSTNIAAEGPGTLLCANGGYRWVSLSELDVDTDSSTTAIKCVFCFFEQDDDAALTRSVPLRGIEKWPNLIVHHHEPSMAYVGYPDYLTRAPPFLNFSSS